MIRTILFLAAFACALCAAELPVTQVVLYKHGVAYFERAGTLAAGETVRLDFKAADMNDVLKSLTVEEQGGGKIAGVRYDSSEPLERKLAEFPFQIEANSALPQALDQVKGAKLELTLGGQSLAGTIVSARLSGASDKQAEKQELTLLLDSGEIRVVDLAAASVLRIADAELQRKLKDYLGTLAIARSKDKRSVYLDSTGGGARRLSASYMAPMPAWKSSYRLIFGADAQPMLEGWAIVDNTTGDDWNNVRLALVSGRPTSFVSNLYEPRYVVRPVAELADDRSQRPVVYEEAMKAPAPAPRQFDAGRLMRADSALKMAPSAGLVAESRMEMASSAAVTTQTREAGELFEYRFANPVTVKRNESAMLPFVQQRIAAKKLLIWSEQASQHPRNAAELSNATGKTLDGGPITVFDANAYAGEALMETLKDGGKRLISYGVDLGSSVTTKFDTKENIVREVHMNRGVLTTKTARQDLRTYTIRNADRKAKTLIVEHPVRPGYTLLSPKASETTANNYRFTVDLPAEGNTALAVTEEYVFETTNAVANLTPDQIFIYTQNKALSENARRQLERILQQKRQIASADEEIRRTTADLAELDRDQQRLRENINSLNRVAGQQEQVQKYALQLAGQETRIAGLRDQQSQARKQKAALDAALAKLIEAMEF